MPYSTSGGFTPQTEQELINSYRVAFNLLTGQELTEEQFAGTTDFQVIENLGKNQIENQRQTAEAIAGIFEFFVKNKLELDEAVGPTKAGQQKIFRNFCKGLFSQEFIDSPGKIKMIFDTPIRGEIATPERKIWDDLFLNAVGCGIITEGNEVAQPKDELGMYFQYYYDFITESDYTPLDIEIKYILVDGGYVNESEVKELFKKRTEEIMTIGKRFYPDYYISSNDFSGVADFKVKSKLESETEYNDTIKDPAGGRFIVRDIKISQEVL